MLRDTTERVQAEQALRCSREELQQLSDSILAVRGLIGGSAAIAQTPGAGFGLTVRVPAVAGCSEAERRIRVMIADDHAVVRDGLRHIQAGGSEIVADAAGGAEVPRLTRESAPNCPCSTCRCRAQRARTDSAAAHRASRRL
ncbi:hypothetical protein BKK81_32885 (plasmid) [Cupriavidus sp. USMAHM13]|nr:hypothetical protein BKK81_32885 [Cupriavidus sp. USMAHM13]